VVRRKDRSAPVTILPGYRDAVEIGGGAFATVYRAIEIDTGRPVALKILKVDTLHPHLVETFTHEIQTLAKVSDHPNIVTLYRPLSTPDHRPVLVLELCRESLAQQVRRAGPLGAREVTRIGIKIAGALETAHRHGFLHRDMKPQNILVTQFGEPALGDFGVAALQASAQATAGVFGFTTLHAAPEILEGLHLSPATDVYGLASTMYQLLSGLAPFATFDNEAPASVILRIIRDPVRPLRSETIPLGLSDLLEAALAKDPEGRPSTAVEFADALVAVEAANDWPPTAYVVLGQDRVAAAPLTSDSIFAQAAPGAPEGQARYPSTPSVAVPEVVVPRPTLSTPPPVAAAAPSEPAASPPPSPAAAVAPVAPPSRPPRTGPSVSPPVIPDRRVVAPSEAGRGPRQAAAPLAPNPPLIPLRPPGEGATSAPPQAAARPVFVDPPTPAEGQGYARSSDRPASHFETVYEQTILPTAGAISSPRAGDATLSRAEQLMASPLLLGGIAAAVIVIMAAILLVVGVL